MLFQPTDLGHITQFPTFDTKRLGMYTPKQLNNFWEKIVHASASDTVLKKLARTNLTQSNTVRFSDPGKIERFLNLDDRLLMDHLLTPSFFVDKFREAFGELGFIIQCLGDSLLVSFW